MVKSGHSYYISQNRQYLINISQTVYPKHTHTHTQVKLAKCESDKHTGGSVPFYYTSKILEITNSFLSVLDK